MSTPLDDVTRALFAYLRGGRKGEIINEVRNYYSNFGIKFSTIPLFYFQENELIALMQTCPLCFTGLETLILGRYVENDVVYERVLWVCPNQRTQVIFNFILLVKNFYSSLVIFR